MLTTHWWVGVAAICIAFIAGIAGAVTWRWGRGTPRATVRQLLALVQTVLIAQVAIGLLLVSDDRRAGEDLHYVYGTLALAAVLAPWFYAPADPRRRLAWFSLTSVLAGALAVRAYTTA
jgi:hypothetical protein